VQRVVGKWSRSRLPMIILIVVIMVVGLAWALAIVSEAWRNAVIATAGVIAASATAWAAYEARRAAMASVSRLVMHAWHLPCTTAHGHMSISYVRTVSKGHRGSGT